MGGLREKYIIPEFRDARQSLDGYYASLQGVARAIKLNSQDEYDRATETMKKAKTRLQIAIEALKLDEDAQDEHSANTSVSSSS